MLTALAGQKQAQLPLLGWGAGFVSALIAALEAARLSAINRALMSANGNQDYLIWPKLPLFTGANF